MAEVSSGSIYRLAVETRNFVEELAARTDEAKAELKALNAHLVATRLDIRNIHTILARHDVRLDRIERRLDLAEPAIA